MNQWVKIHSFLQDQKKIPLLMISVDVTRITWFLQNSLSSKYDTSTPKRALRPLSTIGIGGVGQHKRHTLQIPVFWGVQQHPPPHSKLNFACDIMYSQVVTHPSTNMTQCCLTSVIRRERVLSTWYGHRQVDSSVTFNYFCQPIFKLFFNLCFDSLYFSIPWFVYKCKT